MPFRFTTGTLELYEDESLKPLVSLIRDRKQALNLSDGPPDPEMEVAWKALENDPDENVRSLVDKRPSRYEPYLKVIQDFSRRSKRKARLHNSHLFITYRLCWRRLGDGLTWRQGDLVKGSAI